MGNKRFRVSTLEPDSRTIVDVGCYNPVSADGKEPAQVGPWVDVADAAAHMRAGKSIALQGQGGTGKTFFANEQAQHLTCRIYACAKTHVAVAGLKIEWGDEVHARRAAETLCGPRRDRGAERRHRG